ncbi:RDD family protein [Myxococcota bacterium]|nr:RDD family protein [Myxococcota bacterium]MBU1899062.1 RDD family protein [Myxococcota bacterium]
MNRRTAAYLLEMAIITLLVYSPIVVLFSKFDPNLLEKGSYSSMMLNTLIYALYLIVRDLWGNGSFGKQIMGLKIVNVDDDDAPDFNARLARNMIIIIPLMSIIEFLVAKNNSKLQRIGDSMAGTRIVMASNIVPSGTFFFPTIMALLFMGLTNAVLEPMVTDFWIKVIL